MFISFISAVQWDAPSSVIIQFIKSSFSTSEDWLLHNIIPDYSNIIFLIFYKVDEGISITIDIVLDEIR